jgi:2-iminobutanoate/2-iminopropanoate deaminase
MGDALRIYTKLIQETKMHKQTIKTDKLAAPAGPYCPGTIFDSLIFVSGQVGQMPATGQLISSDLKAQATQAMTNLLHVVEAGGGDKKSLLEINCFLLTMDDFSAFNEVYATFFDGADFPARTCIAVAELPLGAKVEIKAIAFRN